MLHYACDKPYIVERLLSRGANPTVFNCDLNRPSDVLEVRKQFSSELYRCAEMLAEYERKYELVGAKSKYSMLSTSHGILPESFSDVIVQTQIILQSCKLSIMKAEPVPMTFHANRNKYVVRIASAFTREECSSVLKTCFEIVGDNKSSKSKIIRIMSYKNDRNVCHHLFNRIKSLLPATFEGKTLVGPHDKVRFLTYEAPDDFLPPHYDAASTEGDATTLLTVQLYLTDDFGTFYDGATRFVDPEFVQVEQGYCAQELPAGDDVIPVVGDVLVHTHDILHCAVPIEKNVKFALRIDILYK